MVNLIEFNGKIASLSEHCRDLGVNVGTLYARKRRTGESDLECLNHYQHCGVMIHEYLVYFNGKIASVAEHCRDLGINCSTVVARHQKTGEPYEKCLEYYQENGVAEYRNLIGDYKVKNRILYKRWHVTKQKCENPNHPSYKDYGGRGIKVCERWQVYENFENDLLESFLEHIEQYGIKDTQLERVNNDRDYEPSNCCWATCKEQANNKRKRVCKYYLPCNKSLREHCNQNNYDYFSVVYYIKHYDLLPHEALAKYLENSQ